jgi:Phytanoyl-CoA dioxygenase (PhyH)
VSAHVEPNGELRAAFERDGFLVLRGWLDVRAELEPLQRELGMLIEHAARACGAEWQAPEDPSEFDRGYLALVEAHPDVQPLVYDNAKNLVAFQRLIVGERLAGLFRDLRGTELAGTAPGSNGVRIDRPSDDRRLAPWHQEFQYQFRSLDGVTFWIPLVPVTPEMGPVVLARGSHRGGVEPLVDASGNGEAETAFGSYGALRIAGEATIAERYEICAPVSEPGDLFAFDFLTLHASGANAGARARWTVQIRYFNFADAYGASIRWMGGLKHGTTLAAANAVLAEARAAALGR